MENSIVEIIARNAKTIPDRLCVVDVDGEHTYSQVWENAKVVASNLIHLGVKKENCVLVESLQKSDFLVCGFACNLIGAYFVPIEHEASFNRIQAIAKETEAVLMICEKAVELPVNTALYSAVLNSEGKVQAEEWEYPLPEDTAEILYTTGTTGTAKGIEISHKNNIAIAENICFGTEMSEGNVELIPLPLSHSHGLRCCYANIYRNGTVILTDGVTNVRDIFLYIKNYTVTAMDLSPTAASVLLKLTRGKFGQFNEQFDYIQIGTAALPEELKMTLCQQFPDVRLYNFYGSTESGRSCVLNFNSEDDRKYCIGHPTKNAKFIITDDDRNPIQSDANHTGLLASSGAMNMKGYWRQPELTSEIMKGDFIYTNDEGYIDERGYIYVLGRKDDIINYKGIKIAPEEIEEVVAQFKGIRDCACVPVADKIAGQAPKVFLVVQNQETFDKNELVHFLEQKIDGNKLPKYFEFIDEIPRAINGKIQRKKLTAQYK